MKNNKNKGFTLVELIVVIAIMAVLAGTVSAVTVSVLGKKKDAVAENEITSLLDLAKKEILAYTIPGSEVNFRTVFDNHISSRPEVYEVVETAPTADNVKYKAGSHQYQVLLLLAEEGDTEHQFKLFYKKNAGTDRFVTVTFALNIETSEVDIRTEYA